MALQTKPTPGRPRRLSARQMERLRTLLVGRDPRQLEFEFALWTRALVAQLIHREFEIQLSLATISRILHQLGMSPQRPVDRAWQADPAAVEARKATTCPGIVAAAKKQDAARFFGMRHRCGLTATPARPGHRSAKRPWCDRPGSDWQS